MFSSVIIIVLSDDSFGYHSTHCNGLSHLIVRYLLIFLQATNRKLIFYILDRVTIKQGFSYWSFHNELFF
jgi:hypothetical protein